MSVIHKHTEALIAELQAQAIEIDKQVMHMIAENKIMRAALWEISISTSTDEEAHNLVATAQGALRRANDA